MPWPRHCACTIAEELQAQLRGLGALQLRKLFRRHLLQHFHADASSNPIPCARAQSPEKLQARLRETAGALERERARLADAERRSRELQMRLDAIGKARRSGLAALSFHSSSC